MCGGKQRNAAVRGGEDRKRVGFGADLVANDQFRTKIPNGNFNARVVRITRKNVEQKVATAERGEKFFPRVDHCGTEPPIGRGRLDRRRAKKGGFAHPGRRIDQHPADPACIAKPPQDRFGGNAVRVRQTNDQPRYVADAEPEKMTVGMRRRIACDGLADRRPDRRAGP